MEGAKQPVHALAAKHAHESGVEGYNLRADALYSQESWGTEWLL